MMRRYRRRYTNLQRQLLTGFLLLDLIMAVLVLSVAFLMCLGMVPFSMRAAQEAQLRSIGTALSRQAMDYTLYQGFNQVAALYQLPPTVVQETENGVPFVTTFDTAVYGQWLSGYTNSIYQVDAVTVWTFRDQPRTARFSTVLYHP
jgi:Tfp pilus assembly protein PilV